MGPGNDTGAPVVVAACCDHAVDSENAATIAVAVTIAVAATIVVAARDVLKSLYADAEDAEDAGEDHVVDDAVDAEKYPVVDGESAVVADEGDAEDVMMMVAEGGMGHRPAGMEKERMSAVSMEAVPSNGSEDTSEPAVAVVVGPTNFGGALVEGKWAAVWTHGGEGPNMGQIP